MERKLFFFNQGTGELPSKKLFLLDDHLTSIDRHLLLLSKMIENHFYFYHHEKIKKY